MASLIARIPQVDWSHGFDRHWNGGNPAITHAFNVLSFLFPQAESFFIGVVREVVRRAAASRAVRVEPRVRQT